MRTIIAAALAAASALLPSGTRAQKWTYDFIVPDNGSFVQAVRAANTRADKARRYRIFVRASNYRVRGDGSPLTATEGGRSVQIASPMTVLTAPNTSICGEQWQNTQIENCPQHEGLDITCTLLARGADSTYIQDVELWSNFRNDPNLYANSAVALSEKRCRGNVLKNVSLLGTANTYYTNDGGTTYLEDCHIAGTVDFICGGGTVYFNHCELQLVARGDSTRQHRICAPATQRGEKYGYVFADCYIYGPGHQNRRYLLGRAWKNAPRAVFLNCCMNSEPAAEGWTGDGSAEPARFAEFECTDSLFEPLDTSRRKVGFARRGGDATAAQPSPTLSADEAMDYTLDKVFPAWDPEEKTAQVAPPVLRLSGRTLSWDDIPEAGCYAVCRDHRIVAFTTAPRYAIPAGTREGTVYSVRCANQMGGLGTRSKEVVYPQR